MHQEQRRDHGQVWLVLDGYGREWVLEKNNKEKKRLGKPGVSNSINYTAMLTSISWASPTGCSSCDSLEDELQVDVHIIVAAWKTMPKGALPGVSSPANSIGTRRA